MCSHNAQHNDTQHNDIQHNNIKQNNIQHDDTQPFTITTLDAYAEYHHYADCILF